LDASLTRLRLLGDHPRPHRGWIRAVRDALGMSSIALAARMGVSQQTVSEMERSENLDTIKLETLRRAAEALDCDLVYALVPRTSLDDSVSRQARRRAEQHLAAVAPHSRLEDQTVSDDLTAAHIEDLAAQFTDSRGLWSETLT
jgi:predicted DNA-binding mobile mystery protein A